MYKSYISNVYIYIYINYNNGGDYMSEIDPIQNNLNI